MTDPRLKKEINYDHSCKKCQYNLGDICLGFGERTDNGELTLGMPIEEAESMFPYGCEEFQISFDAYEAKSEE